MKGYSHKSQVERLQKFCEGNMIKILQIVFEDHSAKTFERPSWSKLMFALNRQKSSRPNRPLFKSHSEERIINKISHTRLKGFIIHYLTTLLKF